MHSFYRRQFPSGENKVVEEQVNGLEARGHEVALISRTTPARPSTATSLRLAASVARYAGDDPGPALRAFSPDVVHVHNLFPHFGYGWLAAWRGPVVTTLHNYRPFCAKGTISRQGRQCLECLERATSAVIHACYRDSHIASLPLAWRNRKGLARDPLLSRSDYAIFLSERSRKIYARAGYEPGAASVLPNGIADIVGSEISPGRTEWAYVGRLSDEKGLEELLSVWPFKRHSLTVAGDGPLRESLVARYGQHPGLHAPGVLSEASVHKLLSSSQGVVIPSRWAEGLPMVLGEALRAGTPVLARAGSSAADFVAAHGGGHVYHSDEEVPAALNAWQPDFDAAREVYERHLSQHRWLDALESIYRGLQ